MTNQPPKPNIVDYFSNACDICGQYDSATYGDVMGAYQVYQEVRSLSTTELLASIIAGEFTAAMKYNDPDNFMLGIEGLAREFFSLCPDGVCLGDSLWRFLGGLQNWYSGGSIEHYASGNYKQFVEDARIILHQEEWRNGAVSNRPWTWGNDNQMFSRDEINKSENRYSFTVNHGEVTLDYTMGYLGVSYAVNANNPLCAFAGIRTLYILSHQQQLARYYYRQSYPNCGNANLPCIVVNP